MIEDGPVATRKGTDIMIRQICAFTIAIEILIVGVIAAQPADSVDVSPSQGPLLSGFVDVRGVYSNGSDNSHRFSVGQAELDLEHMLSNRVGILLCAAYNSDNGAIELGAAELELTLYENDQRYLNNISLVAGQFDVPFGIGSRYYASTDCETVTSPWFSHSVGNWSGWNDYGVQVQATSRSANAVLFAVNGYEESAEVVYKVYNWTAGVEEDSIGVVVTVPEAAFGGRLGIIPAGGNIELGISGSIGIDDRGGVGMTLLGSDLSYDGTLFGCHSEFIYNSLDREGQLQVSRGCYLQAHCHIATWRVISRYAAANKNAEPWQSQYSAGIALPVAVGTELRCELIRTAERNAVAMVQIVAGF